MKQHLLKHSYAAIVALFIAMFALPQLAQAQTKYNLEIAGKQVTSDNCNNLSVIPGVSGTVRYDPSQKILTLENATINAGKEQALVSRTDGLTIKLIGTNNLSSSGATMGITEALTITGEGATLNVVSETICAVYSNTADITIDNCNVNLKGEYGFLAREDDHPESLIIKKANVTSDGRAGSIVAFTNLIMEGCGIIQPEGARFDAKQKTVVVNGERVRGKVVIAPNVYDLKIVGNDVTFDNCGDLTVFDGVSGTVKYDPRSNILTLKGASITSTTTNAIVSHIDGLTIELIGTNSLTTKENSTLSFTHPLTLTGGGTLNVSALSECGIYLNNTDLTINDCIVNVKGYYGIAGQKGSNEKLLIRNATVTAEGEKGSICDLNSLTLEGCAITQPEGAKFDPSEKAVALNGEKVTSEVVISPQSSTDYELWIAGEQVTSDNCGNLTKIDGVSGTVKYDPRSNILTLKGASITSTTTNAIVSHIDGLTIELIGTNSLTTKENSTLSFTHPLTLTGGGTLNVSALSECGIYLNNTDLTINDCIVNVKGYYGIAGQKGSNEKLLIRNATVTAEGEKGSICDLNSLTLEYSNISQPSGAAFDGSLHGVALGGELVKTQVVIKRDPAGINTPTIDTAAKQGIYTISGVKLNGEAKDLPKGIYIVNGKKVVKK